MDHVLQDLPRNYGQDLEKQRSLIIEAANLRIGSLFQQNISLLFQKDPVILRIGKNACIPRMRPLPLQKTEQGEKKRDQNSTEAALSSADDGAGYIMKTNVIVWLRFFGISLALFVFFTYISPLLISLSPSWQRFVDVQDEIGVTSGALYYTDVAVTQDSEAHIREAVREGMNERKKKNAPH